MKTWLKTTFFCVVIGLLVVAWVLYFDNAVVADHLPKDGHLQHFVQWFGQKKDEAPEEDEDPDTTKNSIPVHTAHVAVATMHRYVDGFGTVAPSPPGPGQMAGSANIASPVAGVVASVQCRMGQQVHAGDVLIRLDDRVARAAEAQAQAVLAQAQASLAAVKATPRPDQLQIAQLTVDKAKAALDFAQKNSARVNQLATDQGVSGKSVEQAANDLATAKADLALAEKQLDLLKHSPTPEELRQEEAKVAQANAALAAARVQREMLSITSPIDATVVLLSVNPGESVDTTRTLVQLVATDRLMVDVDVPAEQLPEKAEGLAAQVFVGPQSKEPVMGKVSFVSPQVDPKTGAVMVVVALPGDVGVRPGRSVRVRIVAEEHKDVLAVPREAVVTDENGDSVIALVEGDQATRKTVTAGFEENGQIEVAADGLKEGDVVVTAGAFGLPQATKVKVLD
jgi:multidrug efflux pump subunit AcrA (membrane-fusion protein)